MNLRRYYLQKLMNTIFLKWKLVDLCVDLILNGLKSMEVGWNIVLKIILHIVYIVTYSIEIYVSYWPPWTKILEPPLTWHCPVYNSSCPYIYIYIYINQEDDNIYDVNNVRMTQVHDAYYIEKINSKKVKPFFFLFFFWGRKS